MTQYNSLDDVYVDVAKECYRRVTELKECFGDGEEAAIAEHAIEMALFGDRPLKDKDRLLDDVMRNARFSVRRSTARGLRATEEVGHLARRNMVTGGSPGFFDDERPEDIVMAHELEECLRDEACRCGKHGERVLAGLIIGESAHETAAAAGVSKATVDRAVRRLRAATVAAGYREAA